LIETRIKGDAARRKSLAEVHMVKIIPVVIATAVASFGAGVWTEGKLAGAAPASGTAATTASTISPFEMQLTVKPRDLPVQYMQGDFN
jgi:hypothetical protein